MYKCACNNLNIGDKVVIEGTCVNSHCSSVEMVYAGIVAGGTPDPVSGMCPPEDVLWFTTADGSLVQPVPKDYTMGFPTKEMLHFRKLITE